MVTTYDVTVKYQNGRRAWIAIAEPLPEALEFAVFFMKEYERMRDGDGVMTTLIPSHPAFADERERADRFEGETVD